MKFKYYLEWPCFLDRSDVLRDGRFLFSGVRRMCLKRLGVESLKHRRSPRVEVPNNHKDGASVDATFIGETWCISGGQKINVGSAIEVHLVRHEMETDLPVGKKIDIGARDNLPAVEQ